MFLFKYTYLILFNLPTKSFHDCMVTSKDKKSEGYTKPIE